MLRYQEISTRSQTPLLVRNAKPANNLRFIEMEILSIKAVPFLAKASTEGEMFEMQIAATVTGNPSTDLTYAWAMHVVFFNGGFRVVARLIYAGDMLLHRSGGMNGCFEEVLSFQFLDIRVVV